MCTHYTLLRNARSKQRSVHVRNSEVRTFETAKCARSKQRSAHLRLATQVRAQILPHAEGALSCFSETARSKSRSRAPPAALRGRSPRGRRLGKSTPATSPERGGRSWASRPSRCAVAARALTPIHSGSAPPSPCAGLWRVFRVKGGSRGWCGPQPRRGARTRPLDATGATQACRQGVGALFPGTPAPRRRPPAGSPEGAYKGMRCGGTPCLGFKGAQPLGPSAANKKPSAEGEHFLLFELRSSALHGPQRGLNP